MESSTSDVKSIYKKFSAGKPDMDGKSFVKMAKDCKLVGKKLTTTDLDLIFAKIKDRTARKITVQQFDAGLGHIAKKLGIEKEALLQKISSAGGPKYKGTKADFVKFHDDKNTYTGVYAKGGPTNVDAGRGQISDISQLADRTKADVRGVKK